jgi:hypothetical protein
MTLLAGSSFSLFELMLVLVGSLNSDLTSLKASGNLPVVALITISLAMS